MRQRSVKNLDEKIENNSAYLVREPKDLKGKWHELFENDNPVYLEIGCGKGQFIFKHAEKEKDRNFIAVEAQPTVALRTLEKAEERKLNNVRIFIDYVNDLNDYFVPGEIDGIYLNFSDPWVKARQAKRRLTYHARLENYSQVLKKGGTVEFKTDNDALFDFSIEEIEMMGYEILEKTRDLHASEFESANFTTEYEDKFSESGKNINYVKFLTVSEKEI